MRFSSLLFAAGIVGSVGVASAEGTIYDKWEESNSCNHLNIPGKNELSLLALSTTTNSSTVLYLLLKDDSSSS